ncbi:flavodoxin family protein [Candidatus Bathyarchaeota archaeon]|nr:MAG: flavodoxin family protein [Candidatus Bathyarchaeota archaeon]
MILGLCGSPRAKTTEYVLRKALEMLEEQGFETEFYTVRGKDLGFCIHCDHCLKGKGCILQDDMQRLYTLMDEAEGFIIATPVYNGGVSAQTKAVMDRTRALLAADPEVFRGKAGVAIAIGGDRSGGQELAIQQIITFYTLNGVLTLSGGFFGANIGAAFWSQDTMEGIVADEEGFRGLRKTIKRFSEFLKGEETS